jgi:hypothetical protein
MYVLGRQQFWYWWIYWYCSVSGRCGNWCYWFMFDDRTSWYLTLSLVFGSKVLDSATRSWFGRFWCILGFLDSPGEYWDWHTSLLPFYKHFTHLRFIIASPSYPAGGPPQRHRRKLVLCLTTPFWLRSRMLSNWILRPRIVSRKGIGRVCCGTLKDNYSVYSPA